MKLFLLFLAISFSFSFSAHAASEYSIRLGNESQQTVWLRDKKIRNAEVHLIGFRSPQNIMLERVMPKKEYEALVKELQEMEQAFLRQQLSHLNLFCRSDVYIQSGKTTGAVCGEALDRTSRIKLAKWMRDQAALVIGR